MKFSILALGAAVASIASIQHCAAQSAIQTAAPFAAPDGRLVSQVGDDFFGAAPSAQPAAPDASFSEGVFPGTEGRDAESLQPPRSRLDPAGAEKSLRVTANSSRQAPMEVLVNTPDAGLAPICWGQVMGGCATPNPVAGYMTRNWCVDGLWDTYPWQNARQCQHIQHHIHGGNRYAAPGCNPACATCAGPHVYSANMYGANSFAASAPGTAVSSTASYTSAPTGIAPVEARLANCPQVPAQAGTPSGGFELTATELPANVPTVPAHAQPVPAVPQVPVVPQFQSVPAGTTLPAVPVPTAAPVIASLPAATLR